MLQWLKCWLTASLRTCSSVFVEQRITLEPRITSMKIQVNFASR